MKRDRPRHPVMLGGQLDPSGSKPSQVLQETETGREEVLPAPQPDVIPEVEPQSIEEPPGPTPRPRPFLRGSRMLPDERVVPCVQAREEEELREVRVVDPRSLNELELTPDVALERLEQEADFPRRGRACVCLTRRWGPDSVWDATAHDPMAALLFPIQERIRPALVRLPDVGVERTSIADTVMREVLEVVHRTEARLQEEGLAPRVDVAEVFDRVASRVPQDGASLDRKDLRDGPEALGHLACLRREFLGGIVGQAHEGMNVSLVRRCPFVRRRIPISRDEGERPKFHAVAEGPAGTIEVFCEETQCAVAFRGESEARDESAACAVIVLVAGLVELLPGGRYLSAGGVPPPPPGRPPPPRGSDGKVGRFLPAGRAQDVAL